MKRIFVLTLASFYLLLTSGFSIHFHYCMGKLRQVSIVAATQMPCNKCGKKTFKKSCCHDEAKWLKINDEHKVADTHIQVFNPSISILPSGYFIANKPYVAIGFLPTASFSPPAGNSPSLHILHCVFRV